MRLKRNHYEILGLSRNATAPEIKAKYHDLARQYHPDRAVDKELAQRLFAQINRAYKTLANDLSRAQYDATLDAEMAASNPSPQGSNGMAGGSPYQQRAVSVASRTAPTGPMPSRPAPTVPLAGGAMPAAAQRYTADAALNQARIAHGRGDMDEALRLIRLVLASTPDSFEAIRLAGDVYASGYKTAEAVNMYQRALKLQPGNLALQDKMRIHQAVSGMPGQPKPGKRPTPAPANKPPEKMNIFKRFIGGAR